MSLKLYASDNTIFLPSKEQITKDKFSEYYKIQKINTLIPCMYPNFINGLHHAYLKNSKGEIVYIITMEAVQGVCEWKIDKYLFKVNTPGYIIKSLISEQNNKLYLQEIAKIKFTIKKIRSNENIGIDTVNVPYFILINNKKDDDIISQTSYSIKMKLPKSGSVSYMSPALKINISFFSKDFLNLEILSGLYLQ